MKLLDVKGFVTPEDSKTHVRIPFELEEGAERLHVRFEYAPKRLDDREQALKLLAKSYGRYLLPEQREAALARAERHLPLTNLITLSLDDASRYRGACHRHDNVQELFVSRDEVSPGLMAGALMPGIWNVTLSLHGIVTDRCDYRLQAWASEEERQ